MTGDLLFLDCETTGLDPTIHRPWEIAWALYAIEGNRMVRVEERCDLVALSTLDIVSADQEALKIGGFHERWATRLVTSSDYLATVWSSIDGAPRLVGSNPGFDDRFVGEWLERQGAQRPWHYHHVDLPSVALGEIITSDLEPKEYQQAARAGFKSNDLSRLCGIEPDEYERHTARGDVHWCVAWWARLFKLTVVP